MKNSLVCEKERFLLMDNK